MRISWKTAACFLLLPLAIKAQPAVSTIQDILYQADGRRFNGTVVIEWNQFQTANAENIARNSASVKVVDGNLRVQLVPTRNTSGGAYYRVRYNTRGLSEFQEYWSVPPSGLTLKLSDVRIAGAPGLTLANQDEISISGVTGLRDELDLRPIRGADFSGPAAVVLSANGQLATAVGDPADCVRVDGTAGPCGTTSGGVSAAFTDGETPAGSIDGSNRTFTLVQAPNPSASLLLWMNGVLQKQGLDYVLSGNVITFVPGVAPLGGDILLASYRSDGSGGGTGLLSAVPQVLCSRIGINTSANAMTELGSCTVPASALNAGDRLEIRFDYTHEGADLPFIVEVRWGVSAMLVRSGPSSETRMSGVVNAVINAGANWWSSHSWGSVLASATGAGNANDSLNGPLVIRLSGQMGGVSSETVTLRQFTVLRYPMAIQP